MPLQLHCRVSTNLPIEVEGITPDGLKNLSATEIQSRSIGWGRESVPLGELFSIEGDLAADATIEWSGNLESVHWIGSRMTAGTTLIKSTAGRHVGTGMRGGKIVATQNVSDFLGMEMTGGRIEVHGNAGDAIGGNLPGSKLGMNRGEILIAGDAGRGVGQQMRRGTIVIGGSTGSLCGWNMVAGSIIVFGRCGADVGAGMKRGTIVLADSRHAVPFPTFVQGGQYDRSVLALLGRWLVENEFTRGNRLLNGTWSMYHGDRLHGSRGELFVAALEEV